MRHSHRQPCSTAPRLLLAVAVAALVGGALGWEMDTSAPQVLPCDCTDVYPRSSAFESAKVRDVARWLVCTTLFTRALRCYAARRVQPVGWQLLCTTAAPIPSHYVRCHVELQREGLLLQADNCFGHLNTLIHVLPCFWILN